MHNALKPSLTAMKNQTTSNYAQTWVVLTVT